MTGRSWLFVQEDLGRCWHVIGHPICVASCHVVLNSGPHANRTYTRIVSAFDVDLLVANQNRTRKFVLMVLRSFDNHSRRGLAALRMLSGSIRTVVSGINQTLAKLP